jgi:hypothetical protein
VLKHFWIDFQYGTSQGKCSFWAPSAKYPSSLFPILGIGEVVDSDLKNLVKASLRDIGAIRLYCLCQKESEQKLMRLWCSNSRVNTAMIQLQGLMTYDWEILDAFLLFSQIDSP